MGAVRGLLSRVGREDMYGIRSRFSCRFDSDSIK